MYYVPEHVVNELWCHGLEVVKIGSWVSQDFHIATLAIVGIVAFVVGRGIGRRD